MLLTDFLFACMALFMMALAGVPAHHSDCSNVSTVTSLITIPGLTVNLPGSTVTVHDCTSQSGLTTVDPVTSFTSSVIPASPTSMPGITCRSGELPMVVQHGTTIWPCGAPDPTDSLTFPPSATGVTITPVQPSDESTSETWTTVTQSTTKTPYNVPGLSTTTYVTLTETTTTSTLTQGTSTIVEPTEDSSDAPSPTAVSSSHLPFPSSLGVSGWNTSTWASQAQTSSRITGVTGSVVASPHHIHSTPVTTASVFNGSSTTGAPSLNSISATTHLPPSLSSNSTDHLTWTSVLVTPTHTSGNSSTALPATATPDLPVPPNCTKDGEYGAFTMTWDDSDDNHTSPFTPVTRPYHHLMFANGFAYVPLPDEPTKPESGPYMAMFVPNMTAVGNNITVPHNSSLPNGSIGAGYRAWDSSFWFDVTGGYFSCNRGVGRPEDGPDSQSCRLEVTSFRWNESTNAEETYQQHVWDLPACWKADQENKCDLAWVDFSRLGSAYERLSTVRFRAYYWNDVATDRVFVMDSLQMVWSDNSCLAGQRRHGRHHLHHES